MPKKDLSLTEKIAKLEQQKEQLLNKRKDELFSIFINTASVAMDNKLLTGALLFLSKSENKDHPILKEFKELATRNKVPSNTKSANT
ncbi:hypothetical protein Trichorick_01483 (plasmid) [Candidatus Trichorickettsia mobilis]|uniref:hypothetical protein n=1 Tax=Candidatus Trichorickettsia mobilis TaxID=1346319 RepID=UPI002B25DC32|nr:hypothetical protein [Candidatus Trichorickettsia mobilis]WPY01570.1 hypothetical protein Trichorick_01483 [Candidatus Trichorickettsia mobilis]